MLRHAVLWSLRQRVAVIAAAIALLYFGYREAAHMPLDVLPSFAPPQATIATEARGLSPTEAEQLVTLPVESEVNGTPGLVLLRSESTAGLSVLHATFAQNSDPQRDVQLLGQRLAAVKLPPGVGPPEITPLISTVGQIAEYALTLDPGATTTLPALRTFAEFTIRPRLLAVPGVADVQVIGGAPEEIRVEPHVDRLAALGLSIGDVVRVAGAALKRASFGFLDRPEQQVAIASEPLVMHPEDLAPALLSRRDGTPVTLGAVAELRLGHEPAVGAGAFGTAPAVVVRVFTQPAAPTVDVDAGIRAQLASLASALPPGARLHAGFREAEVIERGTSGLVSDLVVGGVLVALVLLVFLGHWQTALISLIAIPTSLAIAFLVLGGLGVTMNAMTLGGLAVALGELVDDAVIDVENIWRRLWLATRAEAPASPLSVVYRASLEVRASVVFATFSVALVFVPVFLLGGVPGRIFQPLGEAYVIAVLASLLVATTLTPALAYAVLRRARLRGETTRPEGRVVVPLQRFYGVAVARLLVRWRLLSAISAGLVALAVAGLFFVHGGFLPRMHESYVIVHVQGPPSMALTETERAEHALAQRIGGVHDVTTAIGRIGRSRGLSEDIFPPSAGEIDVSIAPNASIDKVHDAIRAQLATMPGFTTSIRSPLVERIGELVSGEKAPIAVQLFGPDLDELSRLAAVTTATLAATPGLVDVHAEVPPSQPELDVRFRAAALARVGLDATAAVSELHASLWGETVGTTWQGNAVVPVRVVGPAALHESIAAIRGTPIAFPGGIAPLGSLADVALVRRQTIIAHQGGLRMMTVVADAEPGVGLSDATAHARAALGALPLPAGYSATVVGQWQEAHDAFVGLLAIGIVALVAVFFLLHTAFRSFVAALVVLVNMPLALVGGVAALVITGGEASLGSVVGFVTLFGITIRNGIMLVTHYQHLQEQEGMAFGPELVLRGALERLSPILMTALATALGLLPVALGLAGGGSGIEEPLAAVVLGGLVTSTLLNLLLAPALYLRFGKAIAMQLERKRSELQPVE